MSEPKTTIGAMRGTARVVIRTEQPKPAIRLVRDDESNADRPDRVEKDDDNGR